MHSRLRALVIIMFVNVCLFQQARSEQESRYANPYTPVITTDGNPDNILRPGWVVMHWTAPGDDGNIGRAARYEMRYRPSTDGPINSWSAWSICTVVPNMPSPSNAGRIDSVEVRNLIPNSLYYFCIVAYDEAGNRSMLSNSPMKYVPDLDTPRIAGDLDKSGVIDNNDLAILVGILKGERAPEDILSSCDFNGSGHVDGIDVVCLKQMITRYQQQIDKPVQAAASEQGSDIQAGSYK
jgi:hypothetical protein